jgi:hypothetical protein
MNEESANLRPWLAPSYFFIMPSSFPLCHRLTVGDLRPANPHGALVRRCFLGHASAQVNRLEPTTVFLAVLAPAREHACLQRIPLGLQAAENRTDESTNYRNVSLCRFHGSESRLPH